MTPLRLAAALALLAALLLGCWHLLRAGEAAGASPPAPQVGDAPRTGRGELREVRPQAPVPSVARDAARGRRTSVAGRPVPAELTGRRAGPGPGLAASLAADAFVRGRLRSERGAWSDLDGLLEGGVVVDLVSEGEPRVKRRATLAVEPEPGGATAIAFAFERLAPGPYTLTVSSLAPEVWIPAAQRVEAPVEGLAIWCRDRARRVQLAFRVLDADTGAPVEGWPASSIRQTVSVSDGVLLHAGPLGLEGFAVDGALEWSLWAPGYAPAFGDERAFVPESEARWTAEVRLRRGWGARIVALGREPSMQPLANAELRLDGVRVGATDRRGWIDVWSEHVPEDLGLGRGALHAKHSELPECDSLLARSQGHVLVVVLEPVR